MKRYYYLDKEKLKKHINFTRYISDIPIENYKEIYKGTIEFYSENLFKVPIFNEITNEITEATIPELISLGFIKLGENEFLENGIIKSIHDIPSDPNLIKKKFNKKNNEWIEGATLKEQEEYYFNQIIYLNSRILCIKDLGLSTTTLEKELDLLKSKHLTVCFELSQGENV